MVENSHARLVAEVQPAPVFLQIIHNTQALLIVPESAFHNPVQCSFTRMAEGGMPEVMPESNGFHKIFIELQGSGYCTRQPCDFQCVRQSRPVMISLRLKKDLCFMFQPSKGF